MITKVFSLKLSSCIMNIRHGHGIDKVTVRVQKLDMVFISVHGLYVCTYFLTKLRVVLNIIRIFNQPY